MSENNSNTLGVMLAFVVGGVIGAGLALLYAPSSGEETRRRLRLEAERAQGRGMEGYKTAIDTLEEGVGKAREVIEEMKGEVAAAYQAGKEAYQKEKAKHTKEAV